MLARARSSTTRWSAGSGRVVPVRSASSSRAARRPSASVSWRTEVSGGVVNADSGRSSTPRTASRPGTSTPRSASARSTPTAIASLAENTAETPSSELRSATAWPEAADQSPASQVVQAIPARWQAAAKEAARWTADNDPGGPGRWATLRCPRPCRCSAAARQASSSAPGTSSVPRSRCSSTYTGTPPPAASTAARTASVCAIAMTAHAVRAKPVIAAVTASGRPGSSSSRSGSRTTSSSYPAARSSASAPAVLPVGPVAVSWCTSTPMRRLRPVRRERATGSGTKPSSSTARCTSARVAGATPGASLTTRETVCAETWARAATSWTVTRRVPLTQRSSRTCC